MRPALVVLLAFLSICSADSQEPQHVLSNSDVINMVKSGIADSTVILSIQKSQTNFDTSPDGLIQLKTAGVSDAVLNAMLGSSGNTAQPTQQDCSQALDKLLGTFGTADKIASLTATRYVATSVITNASGTKTNRLERITLWAGSIRATLQPPTGEGSTVVVTPDFNYMISGKMTSLIPAPTLQELQNSFRLDPLYIAKHREEYRCVSAGTEQIGALATNKLKIASSAVEGQFNQDAATGRLVRISLNNASGPTITDYSDWRIVDGISVPFKRHFVSSAATSDVTVSDYQTNPSIDPSWFRPVSGPVAASLTFKVLQAESVPYTVQTNGGISTACNISGSTDTTMTATTLGNTTYGNATSTPNLRMNCRTSDTSIRWQHVLNAMFVQASDGNAYIIACDRAWAWSKCVPLKAGDTFLAKRSDKGFVVQFVNAKAKEKEATYSVLQSKSLQ